MPSTALAPRPRPPVRALQQVDLGLHPDLAEVGRARREVGERLAAWLPGDLLDGVLLVLGELVGNALRHAPGAGVGLTVSVGGGRVVVEVRDGSQKPPVPGPGTDPYAESGRGLLLVAALALDWGWALEGEGKTTWALLPVAFHAGGGGPEGSHG